jgi:PAS domain S-box-containing protein
LIQSILPSINSKIVALSLLISLAALITVSLISFIAANNLLKERVEDQLISESTGRGAAVRSLIETRMQQVNLLGTNDIIRNIVSQLYQNKTVGSSRDIVTYENDFQREIDSFQQVLGKSATLENVKVIGIDSKVLMSTNSSENGRNYSDNFKFKRGLDGPFLYFDFNNNKRETIVTVPIVGSSSNSEASTPIGVIIATMDTDAFDQILLNRKGLGETGEVYLVNQNKKMISESRFIENAAFRQTVDTLPVRECFEKGKEINAIYNDYRAIPIVGFSYCAKDLGLVLLAEIDEAEIFGPITQLRNQIIVTSIIISAVVVGIAFYVSRTISRPIVQLRNAVDRISKGDYNYTVDIKSSDEIGHLAQHFDQMRKSVLETNMNLNKLVQERTKELTDMTNALDATAIVLVTDRNGRITKVNQKFVEISKYCDEELIGQNPRILKSGYHSPDFFENMWKTISRGDIFEGEIKNKEKYGTYYWVKTTIVPFLDENRQPNQYIAIQNDITSLKKIQSELQEALKRDKQSAEIIKRHVEELKKTNIELRRTDKLKEEFLSMTSHELKTPLTPIIGWCSALKTPKILGDLTPSQRAAVDTIESNAVKLEKMVSDMLDAHKLELNEIKFNIGEFQVDNLFSKIKKDFEPLLRGKNIQFIIRAEPGIKLFCH